MSCPVLEDIIRAKWILDKSGVPKYDRVLYVTEEMYQEIKHLVQRYSPAPEIYGLKVVIF